MLDRSNAQPLFREGLHEIDNERCLAMILSANDVNSLHVSLPGAMTRCRIR